MIERDTEMMHFYDQKQDEQVQLPNVSKDVCINRQITIKMRLILGLMFILLILLLAGFLVLNQLYSNSIDNRVIQSKAFQGEYNQTSSLAQDKSQNYIGQSNHTQNSIINKQSKTSQFIQSYSRQLINNHNLYAFLKKRLGIFMHHLAGANSIDIKDETKINKQQFKLAIQLITHSPLIINNNERIATIIEKEREYYQTKYNISTYFQLPFCIIVPSYRNSQKYRYFMNLYTIIQQEYSNYHIVIIDDASDDQTAENIQKQLKDNPSLKEKVRLIKNQRRMNHMANIYYAARKECKKGQIFVVIDGDDQLVGRQVFKLINAQYHRSKSLAIYTSHIRSTKDKILQVGISRPYPPEVIRDNSFRSAKHCYSHLRTTWTDLFFLIQEKSLKDRNGNWFNNTVDNAIFISIFEMSCGRVEYLPQITYKYNTFTGNNVDNINTLAFRKDTQRQIEEKPRYTCVKDTHESLLRQIQSYMQLQHD